MVITMNNNFPEKQEAVTLYHFLFLCIEAADHEVLVYKVKKLQLHQKAVEQDRDQWRSAINWQEENTQE